MIYRRRLNSDTWHFVRTCRWWKGMGLYTMSEKKPKHGEFCNECLAKAKRGLK